jgi:hypothetical protein
MRDFPALWPFSCGMTALFPAQTPATWRTAAATHRPISKLFDIGVAASPSDN